MYNPEATNLQRQVEDLKIENSILRDALHEIAACKDSIKEQKAVSWQEAYAMCTLAENALKGQQTQVNNP